MGVGGVVEGDAQDAIQGDRVTQFTIYSRPTGMPFFPYIVRAQTVAVDGAMTSGRAYVAYSLRAARALVPHDAVCLGHHPDDPAEIVETWI